MSKEIIENLPDNVMMVRTNKKVIEHRGNLYEAAHKWWRASLNRAQRAAYVFVDINGIVQEIYEPQSWHTEHDKGQDILTFDGERLVFEGIPAPEPIHSQYAGKYLPAQYIGGQNPVRYNYE